MSETNENGNGNGNAAVDVKPRNPNLRPPWPKGVSANPGGFSKKRRLSILIRKRIRELGLEQGIVDTLLAMALGQLESLKGRDPQFAWFKELLDRVDGPVSAKGDDAKNEAPTVVRLVYPDDDPRAN